MRQHSDRQVAWGLALILFGLIMLGWNGTFHSSDGLSAYTVADSLTRYGRFDTEQIRWMGHQQGMFGPDGLLYSNKGLATAMLALPLTSAGLLLPGLGPVHTSLLLMPLVTAATGALLYLASRRGFPTLPPTAAVLATLAWGLGSLAWPYSKTFFSEPLTALATIGALERLLAFGEAEAGRQREWIAAFGLGSWLALGMLTRTAHAIVLPVFGLAILAVIWRRYGPSVTRWPLRPLLALAGPPVVGIGLTLWYNGFRFGHPLTTGYPLREGFTGLWHQGLVGQLVGPGRGLLWYVPWLVLVVLSIPRAWRLSPVATATAGMTFSLYLLFYSKWILWHGGYCWGPRFLIPVLPMLGWLAVPATARWRRLFTLLAVLAVAVNLIGVAWSVNDHQETLIQTGLPLFHPSTFFALQYAQILGVLRLGRLQTLDVAWMAEGRLRLALFLLALAVAEIGVFGGWITARGKGSSAPGRRGTAWLVLLLVAATYALLWQARDTQPLGYRRLAAAVTAHSPPGTMIWHNDHPGIATFLNLYRGRASVVGMFEPHDTPSPRIAERLPSLVARPQPLWVISRKWGGWGNVLEQTASRRKGVVDEISLSASVPASLPPAEVGAVRAMFYFDAPDWHVQPVDAEMGPDGQPLIRLAEAGLSSPQAKPGQVIAVRLVWEALAPVSEWYQIVVQLIGPDGAPMALHIGPAQNGMMPVSEWPPGQPVTDVHAFGLRADASPGEYRFQVALRAGSDSTRLQTTDGREAVMVGPVFVEAE